MADREREQQDTARLKLRQSCTGQSDPPRQLRERVVQEQVTLPKKAGRLSQDEVTLLENAKRVLAQGLA